MIFHVLTWKIIRREHVGVVRFHVCVTDTGAFQGLKGTPEACVCMQRGNVQTAMASMLRFPMSVYIAARGGRRRRGACAPYLRLFLESGLGK